VGWVEQRGQAGQDGRLPNFFFRGSPAPWPRLHTAHNTLHRTPTTCGNTFTDPIHPGLRFSHTTHIQLFFCTRTFKPPFYVHATVADISGRLTRDPHRQLTQPTPTCAPHCLPRSPQPLPPLQGSQPLPWPGWDRCTTTHLTAPTLAVLHTITARASSMPSHVLRLAPHTARVFTHVLRVTRTRRGCRF